MSDRSKCFPNELFFFGVVFELETYWLKRPIDLFIFFEGRWRKFGYYGWQILSEYNHLIYVADFGTNGVHCLLNMISTGRYTHPERQLLCRVTNSLIVLSHFTVTTLYSRYMPFMASNFVTFKPCDFFLWAGGEYLRSQFYMNKSIVKLKRKIQRVIGELERDVCERVITNFINWMSVYRDSGVGHLLDIIFKR